ncbi:MAG TPA: ankyrin repeat domain-containing protein [Thermoanaerobaculia bacterium]
MLANSGDPNAPQKDGSSVLHAAAARGNAYLVRVVVRKGGHVDARDARGKTPLDLALENGHAEVAELLRHHHTIPRDCRTSRFAYDAGGGPCRMAEIVGLDPLARRSVGVAHNDLEELRRLVARHPELAFAISAADEMTVEASAHMGRRDVVRFLLDQGVPLALPTAITLGELGRARELLAEDPRRIHEHGAHDFYLGWYPSIGGGSVEAAELLGLRRGHDGTGPQGRGANLRDPRRGRRRGRRPPSAPRPVLRAGPNNRPNASRRAPPAARRDEPPACSCRCRRAPSTPRRRDAPGARRAAAAGARAGAPRRRGGRGGA